MLVISDQPCHQFASGFCAIDRYQPSRQANKQCCYYILAELSQSGVRAYAQLVVASY